MLLYSRFVSTGLRFVSLATARRSASSASHALTPWIWLLLRRQLHSARAVFVEHPGAGAVADGLGLQTMQLAARPGVKHQGAGAETHVQGPSSTHVQGSGGGKNQGRRQDSGGGGAHVTPELIDLDGPMMELVGVDPLLNIAIIF